MLILKVLNGPLFGAELALPEGGCFVRFVDLATHALDRDIEDGLSASASTATLTIPFAQPAPNFAVNALADTDQADTLSIVIFDDQRGMIQQSIPLNTPVHVGAFRMAVRGAQQTWSEAVLSDRAGIDTGLPAIPCKSARRAVFGAAIGVAFVCAGFIAAISLLWPSTVPAQSTVHPLAAVPGAVVKGDSGEVYIIAADPDAAALARRTLQRSGQDGQARVMTRAEAASRVEQVLEDAGVRYFAVRMADPQRPVLVLPAELPDDTRLQLRSALPYVSDFAVRVRRPQQAQDEARRLVQDMGLNAAFTPASDHFVIAINDHLNDAQLDALGRALDAYREQWGERYVRFVINQRDLIKIDGIKTGGFGYELRGTRHLFFSHQPRAGGV